MGLTLLMFKNCRLDDRHWNYSATCWDCHIKRQDNVVTESDKATG